MRRAFLLLILCASPAAAADGADDPGCRLTPAECAVVAREVAVDADLSAQDQEVLGIGLSPTERARALIRRDTDRMAERFRHLSAPVATEVARMQACQVLDDAARRDGAGSLDPRCR